MLQVHILGTRGSVAAAGAAFQSYGGNTQCALVQSNAHTLILDAGTGIAQAAPFIQPGDTIRILLTHYHMDHLAGLAMFLPQFYAEHPVEIYGPAYQEHDCQQVLDHIFCPPLWPVRLGKLSSQITFHTLHPNQHLQIGGLWVDTVSLCHPGGSLGYRMEDADSRFVYLFDHEIGCCDTDLESFLKDVDLALCDASYTRAEYPSHVGFGHSSIEDMCALAQTANVKKLLISHHLPSRTDGQLDELQQQFPDAIFAREGTMFFL